MTAQLNRLTVLFAAAFLAVALAAGFWQIMRSDDLLSRVDNPRRALVERRVPRGIVYDRNSQVLADAAGAPGAWTRHYPYPNLAPVLGYVSPVVGSAGIEAALDPVLHGDGGLDPFTIYWRSSVLGMPPPGRAVRLTIDLNLQRAADTALGTNAGAIVLLQAQTGEILALASHPTFDANDIDAHWSAIVNDPSSPLLNRATLALYQPGGAIGPLVVAGAIQAGLISADQPLTGAGQGVTFDGQSINCRQAAPPGDLTLTATLQLGCPGPLAGLGTGLGSAGLSKLFTQIQFFQAPALAIPTTAPTPEQGGVFPDPGLGGIGQAGLNVTPLQMALATAALVRHGLMPAPQLVMQTQKADMGWENSMGASPATPVIAPAVADQVKAMLPNGEQATAVTSTGGKTLAWYLGYAPFDDPRYVVVVLLENGVPRSAKDMGDILLAAVQ